MERKTMLESVGITLMFFAMLAFVVGPTPVRASHDIWWYENHWSGSKIQDGTNYKMSLDVWVDGYYWSDNSGYFLYSEHKATATCTGQWIFIWHTGFSFHDDHMTIQADAQFASGNHWTGCPKEWDPSVYYHRDGSVTYTYRIPEGSGYYGTNPPIVKVLTIAWFTAYYEVNNVWQYDWSLNSGWISVHA